MPKPEQIRTDADAHELHRLRLEVLLLRGKLGAAHDWMYHAQGWLRFVGSFRRAIGHTGFDALDEFTESCPLPKVTP